MTRIFSAAAFALVAAHLAFGCASSPPPETTSSTATPLEFPPAQVQTSSSGAGDAGAESEKEAGASDGGIKDLDATATLSDDAGATTANAACKTDADCVPAECCHPKTCVAKGSAPSCGGVMCTKECRGGTMDCGGGCHCDKGSCAARLGRP